METWPYRIFYNLANGLLLLKNWQYFKNNFCLVFLPIHVRIMVAKMCIPVFFICTYNVTSVVPFYLGGTSQRNTECESLYGNDPRFRGDVFRFSGSRTLSYLWYWIALKVLSSKLPFRHFQVSFNIFTVKMSNENWKNTGSQDREFISSTGSVFRHREVVLSVFTFLIGKIQACTKFLPSLLSSFLHPLPFSFFPLYIKW